MLPRLPPPSDAPAAARRRRWLGHREYWLGQTLFWSGWALLWILGSVSTNADSRQSTDPGYFMRVSLRTVGFAASAFATSHLLRVLFHLLRARLAGWRLLLGALPAIMFAAAGMLGLAATVAALTPPYYNAGSYLTRWAQTFTTLLHWAGVYFAVSYYRQHQRTAVERLRLDAALREAELRALRTQINPHFLFNCLNSVRALLPRELEQPRAAVTHLADLLRAALNSGARPTHPLADELATIADFLALEQLRYAARLRVTLDVAPEARAWPVPPFVVQELLENAVKHGIAPREDGGEITLRARIVAGALHLAVENPGTLSTQPPDSGHGLRNARARLALIFGPAARLELRALDGGRVAAELILPPLPAAVAGP